LISIITPYIAEGIRSIFIESNKLCIENNEPSKYLMTFQNLLSRIPKWNNVIIEEERARIIKRSGCTYLEDLISCVHIIQLKVLTCIRTGNRQKQIDISIPKLDAFLHKVYIHVARKIYKNVYLFEINIPSLQIQKNNRELETIIQECVLITIRDSIPTEEIIRAYLDESIEQEEEITIENVPDNDESATEISSGGIDNKPGEAKSEDSREHEHEHEHENEPEKKDVENIPFVPTVKNIDDNPIISKIQFNDYDSVISGNSKTPENVSAPKTFERLEEISTANALRRKMEEEQDEDDERINIMDDDINLDELGIFNFNNDDNGIKSPVVQDINFQLDIDELPKY
jgi:hypothetical protein